MTALEAWVREITPEITEIRNEIHRHPELSMREYRTIQKLEDYARAHVAYDELRRVGETGLLIRLRGTRPGRGRTLVFRGDIDALPIQEDPGMDPVSEVPGVMHACGHDVHGSINVGAAAILSRIKDRFSGEVLFFIQPGEEILQGAKLFLNDPGIDFDRIDDVAALHCSAELYAGQIGVRYGAILAGVDSFRITVKGVGGHAAHCHTVRDPIVAGAYIVTALQTLVSRETNPGHALVVSVTQFHAGNADNIIPETAEIVGTVRSLDAEDRARAEESIRRVAESVAAGLRTEAMVEYHRGVPPFVCEDEWVDRALRVGRKILGPENTVTLSYAAMGGEDFAFIKEKKPGIFVRLGSRTPGGPYGSAHSPTFYSDPLCIPTGLKTIVGIAADYFDFDVTEETD